MRPRARTSYYKISIFSYFGAGERDALLIDIVAPIVGREDRTSSRHSLDCTTLDGVVRSNERSEGHLKAPVNESVGRDINALVSSTNVRTPSNPTMQGTTSDMGL